MKTFNQTIRESAEGDALYDIKIRLGEWWKMYSKLPQIRKDKAKLEKIFNKVLTDLDEAVDMVYESEPEA